MKSQFYSMIYYFIRLLGCALAFVIAISLFLTFIFERESALANYGLPMWLVRIGLFYASVATLVPHHWTLTPRLYRVKQGLMLLGILPLMYLALTTTGTALPGFLWLLTGLIAVQPVALYLKRHHLTPAPVLPPATLAAALRD